MMFLAMIIALVLLQIWGASNPLQQDNWFRGLQSSIRGLGLSSTLGLIVYIALPLFVTGMILSTFEPLLFGLMWIAAAVLVLLYSFGRAEYEALADRYRSYCLSGDFEAAYLYAQSELGMGLNEDEFSSPQELHKVIQRELLYVGYQRWFAVIFYFVVLGPVGALAYRLLQLSRQGPEGVLVERLLYYVDWIPVRLLAAGFALTGDFLGSRDELISSLSGEEQAAGTVLFTVGQAAMGSPAVDESGDEAAFSDIASREVTDLRGLLSRSAGAWLVVISLLVLLV